MTDSDVLKMIAQVERKARRAAIWSVGLKMRVRIDKNTCYGGTIKSAKFVGFRNRKYTMIAQFRVVLGKSNRVFIVESLPH